jgi:hypothetical protein
MSPAHGERILAAPASIRLPPQRGYRTRVVPITTHLTSEAPLHPKAAELLSTFFARGWAESSQNSSGFLRYWSAAAGGKTDIL